MRLVPLTRDRHKKTAGSNYALVERNFGSQFGSDSRSGFAEVQLCPLASHVRISATQHFQILVRWRGALMLAAYARASNLSTSFPIAATGVLASCSDTILGDYRTALTPICSEPRQTEQVRRGFAKFPSNQPTFDTEPFPFWIQPVAMVSEERLRQLKLVYACPEKGGTRMATLSCFSASLLYGVSSGNQQTQNAVSMAKPEV